MRVGDLLSGGRWAQRGLHRLSLSVLDGCLFGVQGSLLSASLSQQNWRGNGGLRGSREEWWMSSIRWSSRRLLNQFAQNWRMSRGRSRWMVRFSSLSKLVYSVGSPEEDEVEVEVGGGADIVIHGISHTLQRSARLDR